MSPTRERALFVMRNVMVMAARMANEGRIERTRVELSLEEITTIVAALRAPELTQEQWEDVALMFRHESDWQAIIHTIQEKETK